MATVIDFPGAADGWRDPRVREEAAWLAGYCTALLERLPVGSSDQIKVEEAVRRARDAGVYFPGAA